MRSADPTPFTIAVPQADLDDLRRRLADTRWPDRRPDGTGWSRGVPAAYLRGLADRWRDTYDWRAHERELNGHPQWTTIVDGQRIHFIHVRSPHPDAVPLLLLHGWPGSIVEFLDVIGPLTDPRAHGDPAPAFHVIVPSLPGYGLSVPTADAGWDVPRIADAFAEVLHRLGYERYGVHGGDWGAAIARELGLRDPDHVVGVHVTQLSSAVATSEPTATDLADLDDDEARRTVESAERYAWFMREQLGYASIQSTRPRTIAYALNDSPVGQLAWIVDKVQPWIDARQRDDATREPVPDDAVDTDRLLTNVSLYWFTRTAGSSAQLYYETAHSGNGAWGAPAEPSSTPTGVTVFPGDCSLALRHLAERTDHIVHWARMDRGGHFPGLEVPELLTGAIRDFFGGLS